MVDDTFHNFSLLPAELRREIWRYCLPHRVGEIDDPSAVMIYNTYSPETKEPCSLYWTGTRNNCPPLLTRVCHESRSIALESGAWFSRLVFRKGATRCRPHEISWEAGNAIDRGRWWDPLRESAHMSYTPSYDVESLYFYFQGNPLAVLAEQAKESNGNASFMLEYMTDYLGEEQEPFDGSSWYRQRPLCPSKEEDTAGLKLLPAWLVVVRLIVIHSDFAQAAKTGFFGHLRDAPVQVVDAALPLASQLYELAERCERAAPAVTVAQDFRRMGAEDMDAMVKRVAFKAFDDREVGEQMRPAIMFRLCTKMCNHVKTVAQEVSV